jgi:hypothetical protein
MSEVKPLVRNLTLVTASYLLAADDDVVIFNGSSAATMTLPANNSVFLGTTKTIRNNHTAAINLAVTGLDTVVPPTTVVATNTSINLISNGASIWFVV